MASPSKSDQLYQALLHLYPATYRRKYGEPMAQTFDDMLADERHAFGRLRVWARTLADLPFSALKQHITNGKEIPMTKQIKFLIVGLLTLAVLASFTSWWFGTLHARQATVIERVTPAQLADAMQQDHFYSDYGNAGLLLSGKVSNVQQSEDTTLVTFVTNRPYSVTCQFTGHVDAQSAQTISVAAPGGRADRQPHGVLLHSCLLN